MFPRSWNAGFNVANASRVVAGRLRAHHRVVDFAGLELGARNHDGGGGEIGRRPAKVVDATNRSIRSCERYRRPGRDACSA
jgi:hypothetical protein